MGKYFDSAFWQEFFNQATSWVIEVVPAMILILIVALIALKLIRVLVGRARKLIAHHLCRGDDLKRKEGEKRVETLTGILQSVLNITLWTMVGMLVLRRLGIDIAPIIAGAGIVGLAIGFGAQELVRDFISGFFILLEDQVRVGDVAIVNGTGGLVERIGLRTIILRDLAGIVHIYQNGKISTLSNMTKEWSAMIFEVGVAYKEDTDKVMDIMRQVDEELRSDEEYKHMLMEPMEIFGVDKFADSAVIIKARLKTKPIQQWSAGREYRRRLKKAFDEIGIEIPFPHQTIYWGSEAGPLKVETTGEGAPEV